MNIVVAVDKNWGVGKQGQLLFHLPPDLQFFKQKTLGKVVIMGQNTLLSLPNSKALPNRTNFVLTFDKDFKPEGCRMFFGIDDVLQAVKKYPPEDVFIIGGASVYKQFAPYCEYAYITKIFADGNADCFFYTCKDWEIIEQSETRNYNGIEFAFCTLKNPNK